MATRLFTFVLEEDEVVRAVALAPSRNLKGPGASSKSSKTNPLDVLIDTLALEEEGVARAAASSSVRWSCEGFEVLDVTGLFSAVAVWTFGRGLGRYVLSAYSPCLKVWRTYPQLSHGSLIVAVPHPSC